MNELNGLVYVLIPVNTAGLVAMGIYIGKIIQRVQDLRERMGKLEDQKADVVIANISGRLDELRERLAELNRSFQDLTAALLGVKRDAHGR